MTGLVEDSSMQSVELTRWRVSHFVVIEDSTFAED